MTTPTTQARTKKAKPKQRRCTLTMTDICKLNVETFKSPTTIRRWAAGYPVTRPTELALAKAALKLGIEVAP